ncbi:hypothetical protein SOASR032_10320 [Pragia fontium]|uniref:Fimbrial protein n=1 Tax=Pragia fontium TaxID=82985 RepID=A0ABQ5LFU7_9GAMM|nr:hypothetical protein [Pragia fontium]GKX62463.1 hypothetical protein SOASR032_10320 [Pragia fontium]
MKYQTSFCAKALLLLITWIVPLSVTYADNTGRITFYGVVVDSGCQFSTNDTGITQTCAKGNKVVTSQMAISKTRDNVEMASVDHSSNVHFYWLDKAKGLGITEVTYK